MTGAMPDAVAIGEAVPLSVGMRREEVGAELRRSTAVELVRAGLPGITPGRDRVMI